MKNIMVAFFSFMFLPITANDSQKTLTQEERERLLERAILFHEYAADKKVKALWDFNRGFYDPTDLDEKRNTKVNLRNCKIEDIPTYITGKARSQIDENRKHNSKKQLIIPDTEKQFIERWVCPKILYPFAWLIYGNKVAKGTSWFRSNVKPVKYYQTKAFKELSNKSKIFELNTVPLFNNKEMVISWDDFQKQDDNLKKIKQKIIKCEYIYVLKTAPIVPLSKISDELAKNYDKDLYRYAHKFSKYFNKFLSKDFTRLDLKRLLLTIKKSSDYYYNNFEKKKEKKMDQDLWNQSLINGIVSRYNLEEKFIMQFWSSKKKN